MYNRSLKIQFIDECIRDNRNAQKICLSIFTIIESWEIVWGADICTRSVQDLQPIFNFLNGVRANTFSRVIILRRYLEWCFYKGVLGATKEYLKVKIPSIDTMRERSVISSKQVQKYLDAVFEPEEKLTMDNVYRCYYWLAFMGVEKTDALFITIDDVDLASAKIIYNNIEYKIYKEAIPAFQNCVRQTQFMKRINNGAEIFLNRHSSKYLLRGIKNIFTPESIAVLLSNKNKIAFAKKKIDKKMTYDRFWLSGLFCRTYSQEIAGNIVDFSDIAIKLHDNKEQKRATANYAYEYEIWKATFN